MRYGFTVEDHDYDIQMKALSEYGCDEMQSWPSLSALAALLVPGDEVVCWRADKLAKTVDELQAALGNIHQRGATVRLLQENLATDPGDQRLLDQLVAIISKLNDS